MQLTVLQILHLYEIGLREAMGSANYNFIKKEFDKLFLENLELRNAQSASTKVSAQLANKDHSQT